MKLRYLFTALLFTGAAAPLQAQSIDHMRKLLQEIQQEIDCLEKEQAETLKPRKEPQPVESTEYVDGVIAVDTLPSGNDAVMIVLFNDNTWKYLRNRDYVKDSEIYTRCWDTTKLFPYRDVVKLADLPRSVDIELVDSLKCYHYPYKAAIRSKFGMRRRRKHQGVDLPLKTGDPIYATFNGKVRISIPSSKSGGYGNLIVIRHDNGLETFYGHLSERIVHADEWVEAGQIIGYGGSTGRSTGPHLHFETRYCGQSFDPERLIDFQSGNLRRETFLLKKSYLDIHSNASQDFEDEEAEANDEKRAEEARKALASAQYHRIRSGDTLGGHRGALRHDRFRGSASSTAFRAPRRCASAARCAYGSHGPTIKGRTAWLPYRKQAFVPWQ